MTAITQTKIVMEALVGKTLPGPVRLKAARDYIRDADSSGLTNEEIAQAFLELMLSRAKDQIKHGAYARELENNEALAVAARDGAISGL